MIEKFYDKIHTIFDGLADDQRVTIYNQLGEKLMNDNLLPSQTSKPKKARGWGKKAYKHIWNYDASKPAISRIEGTMVKDYSTLAPNELFIIMHNKNYVVCKINPKRRAIFLDGDYNMAEIISPEFISPDRSANWKDLNRWCDKHYNK